MESAGSDNSLPFGQGASAFGSEDGDEEDVIPERRLSLDLRLWEPTAERYDVERAASPAPSYVSMHSEDWSFNSSETESDEDPPPGVATKVQLERPCSSESSACSFYSDEGTEGEGKAERRPRKKSCSQPSPPAPVKPELVKDPNEKRHPALTIEFAFKVLQSSLKKLAADELKIFKRMLWERYPECFQDPLDGLDIVDVVDKMLETCDIEVSLKITLCLLKEMNLKKVSQYLQGMCQRNEVRYELKLTLKRKYENMHEGLAQQGQQCLFESVYTDLLVTQGGNSKLNLQHEIRKIEELKEVVRGTKQVVNCKDIFDPEIVKKKHVRTLITRGTPGIGKSSLVQKFILDWVNGVAHEHVFLLIPLPFKELNQMAEGSIAFMDLICRFYPEMKKVDSLEFEDCQVMFICDGLDDCVVPIDFSRTAYWCDLDKPTTLRMIITNLIRGNLLYSSYVWVTSRGVAIDLIPGESVHLSQEVCGFTDEQKEAYFRKVIPNAELAERAIAHIKSCKTLYYMCHLPLFCWVVHNVLEGQLQSLPAGTELPKTITHFYTNLLLVHLNMRGQKLKNSSKDDQTVLSDQEFLLKLGKIAFQLLEKNLLRIEKDHWKESGLHPRDVVVTTGLCTQFYREKFVMYHEKVDCFVHPTVQEYMAALYVFLSFKNNGKNVLDSHKFKVFSSGKESSLTELYKSAIEKALHSKNVSYEIFLRFLLGMSVEANQELLRGVLHSTGSSLQAREETARYIRKKLKEGQHLDKTKSENLERCLDELFPHPQSQ